MRIIFLGTPDYVNSIIKVLNENFDLVKTIRSPKEALDQLNSLHPDLFVVASFGKIISTDILNIPKFGAINIHPSQLPKYRGPSPIQSQILDGIKDSAVSFILMDEEMDHGPILKQIPFQLSDNDTFESLCQKMFAKSSEVLSEIINDFSKGKITPKLQDHANASYCSPLKKEDGYFEIETPPDPEKLEKMIRAYYPWPGTWTKWNGKIVKFLPEGKVQMEGKNPVKLEDFLRGYPEFPLNMTEI